MEIKSWKSPNIYTFFITYLCCFIGAYKKKFQENDDRLLKYWQTVQSNNIIYKSWLAYRFILYIFISLKYFHFLSPSWRRSKNVQVIVWSLGMRNRCSLPLNMLNKMETVLPLLSLFKWSFDRLTFRYEKSFHFRFSTPNSQTKHHKPPPKWASSLCKTEYSKFLYLVVRKKCSILNPFSYDFMLSTRFL